MVKRFFIAAAALLATMHAWAGTSAVPQVKQVYLKNDGAYLQWKAVYAADFNWDFNNDRDRGPTLQIFGLSGQASGESIETRVKLDITKTSPTFFTSLDYMGADGKWLKWMDNEKQGNVSGKEVTGYISLASLAKAGLSLPADPKKLTFGNYYIYCGNENACPNTDLPGGAFQQLSNLDNTWRLVLDMDSPRTAMLIQADCIFAWAQQTAPQYFSQAAGQSQTAGAYYYQYWRGSNAILAVDTDKQRLAYLGPLSGGALQDLGDLPSWRDTTGCK